MGNLVAAAEIYREEPLKDLQGEFGGTEFYKYGACRVTGWRKEQEDKMVCLPGFYQDYSFFAVYDGHGGGETAEYLSKYLHKHLIDSLNENPDKELALYLAFLTCDLSLREITKEEFYEIRTNNKKCSSKRTSKPISSSGSNALAGPSGSTNGSNVVVASGSAEQNYDVSGASCSAEKGGGVVRASGSTEESDGMVGASDSAKDDMAGASGSQNVDLPRASDSAEDAVAGASNLAKDDMSGDSGSAEENEEELIPRVKREVKRFIAQSKTVRDLYNSEDLNDEDEEDDADFTVDDEEMDEDSESSCQSESNESNSECNESDDESDSSIIDKAEKFEASPLIGPSCGSTATVVLFNQRTVYVANVGDSRCIASINGKASVLSIDHSPDDSSERDRIMKAGSRVKNGRIDYGLNMSRSFGDYGLKMKKAAETFQAVTCEPDIKVIDITNEMDFIVLASDGIWNVWDNQDVVDFIKEREMMELEDICAEMFEALMPWDLTDDGTGCDNMTMIIVKFGQSKCFPNFLQKQSVVYRYPKQFSNRSKITQTDEENEPYNHTSIYA